MRRDEKLAVLEALAIGIRHGMPAFDERLAEMGPGPAARGSGPGAKGTASDPTWAAFDKPPRVVESQFDRILNRTLAGILYLDAAYGEIARTQRGLPAKGEPSCAWCAEAVAAAAKVEAKEGKAPIRLDYRSRTYLFAEERKGDKVVGKVLVCEWCYRFDKRNGHKPSIEERWVHAQGGRQPKKPKAPHQRRAERVNAS